MMRYWLAGGALLLIGAAAHAQVAAQISPMTSIEPEIVRGAKHATSDAATNPAPGTSTAAMVRETNAAAGPVDPIAPGTPNAGAPRAHLQPHR